MANTNEAHGTLIGPTVKNERCPLCGEWFKGLAMFASHVCEPPELTRLRTENETLKAENKRLATMNEHHRTTKSMAMDLAKDFSAEWEEAKTEIERLQGELSEARAQIEALKKGNP